jgi:O-acetyl-ADP-ribose deacetylase
MIEVRLAELAEVKAEAVLRPVSCDFAPVNPAMRRFDRLAGPAVAEQCSRLGELPLGSAAITAAGDIAAGYIVHVAVRSVDQAATPAVVQRGLLNGLRRLEEWGIRSVAMAPLGTGAGNLDAEESATAMLPVLVDHMRSTDHIEKAVLVVEDAYQETAFRAAVARFAGELAGTGS